MKEGGRSCPEGGELRESGPFQLELGVLMRLMSCGEDADPGSCDQEEERSQQWLLCGDGCLVVVFLVLG